MAQIDSKVLSVRHGARPARRGTSPPAAPLRPASRRFAPLLSALMPYSCIVGVLPSRPEGVGAVLLVGGVARGLGTTPAAPRGSGERCRRSMAGRAAVTPTRNGGRRSSGRGQEGAPRRRAEPRERERGPLESLAPASSSVLLQHPEGRSGKIVAGAPPEAPAESSSPPDQTYWRKCRARQA